MPGKVLDADKYMVEIGTGYYVEKNRQSSMDFCERKMKMLMENMDKVTKITNQKRRYLELVIDIINKKVQDARSQN